MLKIQIMAKGIITISFEEFIKIKEKYKNNNLVYLEVIKYDSNRKMQVIKDNRDKKLETILTK